MGMDVARMVCACVLLLAPCHLVAQYATPYGPMPGSRVRVLAPSHAIEPLTGRLLAIAGDSLLLDASAGRARVRLSAASVQRVEVSKGYPRWEFAKRYGMLGSLAGGVIGAITFGTDDPLGGLAGIMAGAIIGAPIGAASGAILAPERWHDDYAGSGFGGSPGSYRLTMVPRTAVEFAMLGAPTALTRGEAALVTGDTLLLVPRDSRGARSVRLSDLAVLQVRGGKDRPRGIAFGAAALALITAVAGGIDHAHGNLSTGDLIGTVAGNAVIGGLVGYALAPTGWESVALPRR